jgi:hypothetical protein
VRLRHGKGIAAYVFVATLVTSLAMITLGNPASAHKDGFCDSVDICVWEDNNYSGGFLDYAIADDSFLNDVFFVTANIVDNRISSGRNFDPNCEAWLYRHPGFSTDWVLVAKPAGQTGDRTQDMGANGRNDLLSSLNWHC